MTEFENVLEACLRDLELGASNMDECLRHHPKHAGQLEPILLTRAYLARGRAAQLSPAFKRRVRSRLIQEMYTRPRKPARSGFVFMRLAASLAVVLLALLVTGTVYAQRALPGQALYTWKLASENAWRMVSPDPVATDLAIAQRRVTELMTVGGDPTLYSQTLDAYLAVTNRQKSEMNAENEALILMELDSQIEELHQAGIILPQLDPEILPPVGEPTRTPTSVPTPTPLPEQESLLINPTQLPSIVPTVIVPPEIIPTVQLPPEVVPTVQVPPEIVPTVQLPPIIPTIKLP
jgi:hypothetical protein